MRETGQRVTRTYKNFKGVDLRDAEGSLQRSPDSLNMWPHRLLGGVTTRPSMELLAPLPAAVWGIYELAGQLLVHSGTGLYRVEGGQAAPVFQGLRDGPGCGFVCGGALYLLSGGYFRYDGEHCAAVEGIIPTTTLGRSPAGGGTAYQDVNMLTPLRENAFLADGLSCRYFLDSRNIDTGCAPRVWADGVEVTDFETDFAEGVITFAAPPAAPLTDGQDNVVIRFSKTVPGYREAIEGCTVAQVFDNRVFFSGSPEHPGLLWHSSLNEPAYISDLDYYRDGLGSAPVRALLAGHNALWVFTGEGHEGGSVFYHIPTLDDTYGKIYPASHSGIHAGCVGRGVNFMDDPVFFSARGMEGITGDFAAQPAARHRSTLADPRLVDCPGYADMVLAVWEGYLLVCMGERVFLADSRRVFQHEDHTEYEWFYWELEKPVTAAAVVAGVLHLGSADGVYTLTGSGDLPSHWVTPRDRFGANNLRKTTNKRGCIAECLGDVQVLASVQGGPFEEVGRGEALADHLVVRLKRKKFKDLQLKFQSSTRFTLESVSLECFMGGYVK